jgi:hypothetical protein
MRRPTTAQPRLSPSLRRKIDDLATWVGEGRPEAVAEARRAFLGMLAEAARGPFPALLRAPGRRPQPLGGSW